MNIDEQFAQVNARLDTLAQKIETVETNLTQKIEAVETALLTEFHKWASPSEMRQRTHAAAIRALDTEIENHEDRLKKLEGHNPSH